MTAEESYPSQKPRLCAQTFQPILSIYMIIFTEKHRPHLIAREESSPNFQQGDEHLCTRLGGSASASNLEHEMKVLPHMLSPRVRAIAGMNRDNRVRDMHTGRGGAGRKTSLPSPFSVPLTSKVPLAFSWKVAGYEESTNRYLSTPYSRPLHPCLQGPESGWALWEPHRQGSPSSAPEEQAFGGEHHCGSRKFCG